MNTIFEKKLIHRSNENNLRQLVTKNLNLVDFASNDYLGLSRLSELSSSILIEWKKNQCLLNGFGSTGSRLISGNSEYIENLENQIASFHGFEAGLIFNCGYMANTGLISSICEENDTIFFDSQIHASSLDGIRLSHALSFPFRHNDLNHLEMRIKNNKANKRVFILVESVYSTDGSLAPLKDIVELSKKYNAFLIVDEAHAVGVFGHSGKGLASYIGTNDIFALIITFGKALGTQGAIILGSKKLREYLVNFSKPFIYSTALPFISLAAIKSSYEIFPKLNKEREYLFKLIEIFQSNQILNSTSPIQPFYLKGNYLVKDMAQMLLEKGFNVTALMSPTVQKNKERLRICLHAFNKENEIKDLINFIKQEQEFLFLSKGITKGKI